MVFRCAGCPRGGRGVSAVRTPARRVGAVARGGWNLPCTSRSWPMSILPTHFLRIFPVLPSRPLPCRLLMQVTCRTNRNRQAGPAGCFGAGSDRAADRMRLPGPRCREGGFAEGAESCCAAVGRRGQHTGNQQGGRGEENVSIAFRTRGKRAAYPFRRIKCREERS